MAGEHLRTGLQRARGLAKAVKEPVLSAVGEELPVVAAVSLGTLAGVDYANGNHTAAAIETGLAVTALGYDCTRRVVHKIADQIREARRFQQGVQAGLGAGLQISEAMSGGGFGFDFRPEPFTVIDGDVLVQGGRRGSRINEMAMGLDPDAQVNYTSLDGETVITDPRELLEQIGDPIDATVRLGLIVTRASEEGLSHQQAEYLRMVQETLRLFPEIREALCEDGTDIVDSMDRLVADYEIQYRIDHPTVSEE